MQLHGGFLAEKKKLLIIGGAVLLVVIAIVAGIFAWNYFNDPARANRETVNRILADVGKIYDLPTDEEPSVAKMQDTSELNKQEFYQKAQTGDFVLIYKKAQLAIIYRESAKKLINVDHVEIGDKP